MNNENRVGRFTSSNAYKLIKKGSYPMNDSEMKAYKKANPTGRAKNTDKGFASPGLTYIEEKQIEIRMQSCIDANGAYSQSMAWGSFMELVIFSLLGMEYKIESKKTYLHPHFGKFWSGSADLIVMKGEQKHKIAEMKCFDKKHFAQYTDAITKEVTETFTIEDKIANLRDNHPEEYWQIVSNACIHEVKIGEAITYMPYESEMVGEGGIIELANNYEGEDKWKYRFITERPLEQLPVLKDGGHYKNLNIFTFEIPQEDKDYLTDRMVEASSILFKGDINKLR